MRPSGIYRIKITLLVGLVGMFAGCINKSPQIPRIPIGISIPVANDTTTIQDVVEDRSEYLQFDTDGRMTLDVTTVVNQREVIGERLQITPQAANFGLFEALECGFALISGIETTLRSGYGLSSLRGGYQNPF